MSSQMQPQTSPFYDSNVCTVLFQNLGTAGPEFHAQHKSVGKSNPDSWIKITDFNLRYGAIFGTSMPVMLFQRLDVKAVRMIRDGWSVWQTFPNAMDHDEFIHRCDVIELLLSLQNCVQASPRKSNSHTSNDVASLPWSEEINLRNTIGEEWHLLIMKLLPTEANLTALLNTVDENGNNDKIESCNLLLCKYCALIVVATIAKGMGEPPESCGSDTFTWSSLWSAFEKSGVKVPKAWSTKVVDEFIPNFFIILPALAAFEAHNLAEILKDVEGTVTTLKAQVDATLPTDGQNEAVITQKRILDAFENLQCMAESFGFVVPAALRS